MLPRRDQLQIRLAADDASAGGPLTYDKHQHTVEAVISMGSPVKRSYGTELLRISPDAVDLSRLREGGIPLLDHHAQSSIDKLLGRLVDAWFEHGALVGRFKFNQTEQGQKAEGMVARGELTGISAGYRVDQWQITDADGGVVDERDARWDDDLTFTATRWQLFEASLVGVPADAASSIRSLGDPDVLRSVRARMRARHNIVLRNSRLSHE
ncbi:HK97 family phage prohead protease [Bradyrhizobium sp. STM 3562]|uniref:HK97 family phage prohead protease n=1 Tax=Bradyrhizobium sp. STM 3562 TaxID=578924 RepID=UPI00388FFFD9